MVITLTDVYIKNQLGMELVYFTMATTKESFPIRHDYVNGVDDDYLKTIGWSKAYDERRNFEF